MSHQICDVSTNINQFPNDILGVSWSFDVWYEVSAFSADPTPWGIKSALTSEPPTWSWVTYACGQAAKMWRFHDHPSTFSNRKKLTPNLRKAHTYSSQMNIHRKLTDSAVEEMCRTKGSGGVWSIHGLVSAAPSHHVLVFLTRKTLWAKMLMHFFEVSRNRLIDWITGHRWLISISVPFLLLRGAIITNLYPPVWVLVLGTPIQCVSHVVFWKSSSHLWKGVNYKSFRRPGPWNRKRIKHG